MFVNIGTASVRPDQFDVVNVGKTLCIWGNFCSPIYLVCDWCERPLGNGFRSVNPALSVVFTDLNPSLVAFHYQSDQCVTNTHTALGIAHKLLVYLVLQLKDNASVCNVIITRALCDARILDGWRELFIS